MSFSGDVKRELCRLPLDDEGCMRAELAGMLVSSAVIDVSPENRVSFEFRSENAKTAGRLFHICDIVCGVKPKITIDENKRFGHHHRIYRVSCDDDTEARAVLKDTRILKFIEKGSEFKISAVYLSRQRFLKSYLRGVFLACGSITDPNKDYHLELAGRHRAYLKNMEEILKSYDIHAVFHDRRTTSVLHIKDCDSVIAFLGMIGASRALLKIEDVRIMKEMRNGVNRQINCDMANVDKTMTAAQEQIRAIRVIDKTVGIDSLPENLRELADLRVMNPDASLKELGEMAHPPLGKSAVYRRFEKIKKIAAEH